MRSFLMRGMVIVCAVGLWAAGLAGENDSMVCGPEDVTTVYLVRHAEKLDGEDPGLSSTGETRALALAEALADVDVHAIRTTQLRRTRATAAVVARRKDLTPTVDPVASGQAEEHARAVARTLRSAHCGQTVLVVGHSNTLPLIIAELTGLPETSIDEAEYDRIYQLRLTGNRSVEVFRARYSPE